MCKCENILMYFLFRILIFTFYFVVVYIIKLMLCTMHAFQLNIREPQKNICIILTLYILIYIIITPAIQRSE